MVEPALVGVPAQFEAVAEALAAEADVTTACAVIGHELAQDSVDLSAALDGLRTAYQVSVGREPSFAAVEALSLAWSEETLSYLHQLSCEDPLTGLASQAHMRARLSELYRGALRSGSVPSLTHVLVVVELPMLAGITDGFSRALWLVQAAEEVRAVFLGDDTVSRVGATRLVILTRREAELGRRMAALSDAQPWEAGAVGPARVWAEGLPVSVDAAAVLLDELSRR